MIPPRLLLLALPMSVILYGCAKVEDPSLYPLYDPAKASPPPEKPLTQYSETRNVFFGDLHIHTSFSYDAYINGVRTLPEDAYRFMKGGTIEHGMGFPIKLSRPLDFGAVTDHGEYLGVPRFLDRDNSGENQLRSVMESGNPLRITFNFLYTIFTTMGSAEQREKNFGAEGMGDVSRRAWQRIIDAAERNNEPGRFTAFIGYEWTSMPNADNLHRNVIYKTSSVPDFPFTSRDSDNPEDLWSALDEQRKQGMQMFAIPHNGNVSNGRMYRSVSFEGEPLSPDYAKKRMFNEPISEIMQVKGASETHPILSVDDEFADFEIYDQRLSSDGSFSEPKGSYARDALRTGLELSHSEGFNPYKFGVIGSTDSHNSSSPIEESSYHGKLPLIDGTAGLRQGVTLLLPKKENRGGRWSAMGLAGVWAEENTRASLYDAMRRKETYATSGPRITVRFFAGWDYDDTLLQRTDAIEQAYMGGVPMGGTLTTPKSPGKRSPVFVLWAAKDPQGANLDRVQIIKGWVDSTGHSHEKIYNIAASDKRTVDAVTGKLPAVGNTVDISNASYANSIGDAQLATLWRDPDFNPDLETFYYARVLEIPTPRYSTFDAIVLGIVPPEPSTIQERAISSAIWVQAQ